MEQTMPADEQRARALKLKLDEAGLPCALHADHNAPWGVRFWLTPEDGPEGRTPSFFLLNEMTEPCNDGRVEWYGCFGGFSMNTDANLQNVMVHILEWGDTLDEKLDTVVNDVRTFLRLLIMQDVTEDEDEVEYDG